MTRNRLFQLGTPGDRSYGPGHWLPLLDFPDATDARELPDCLLNGLDSGGTRGVVLVRQNDGSPMCRVWVWDHQPPTQKVVQASYRWPEVTRGSRLTSQNLPAVTWMVKPFKSAVDH